MKAFKKLLLALTLPTMAISLNACADSMGFFGDNGTLSIESITTALDEDGNTIVTITYNDLDYDPVSFIVPKGNDGEMGNGIKEIRQEADQFGNVTVTIYFTNTSIEPVSFPLKAGTSIVNVRTEIDETTGNTIIYFIDSQGKDLNPITVFKGDTGEEGVGISDVSFVMNDDNSIEMSISMTDGREPYVITIPAPHDGNGIANILSSEADGKYYLTINYTNGYSDTVVFDAPPRWYSGSAKPSDIDGMDNDYFFDTAHGVIYHKVNGTWTIAVKFSTDDTTYTVTFNLNDSNDATLPTGYVSSYSVKRGEYFASTGKNLPIPTRYNSVTSSFYNFVGWCTSPDPIPTNGYFTDLTPVFADITLYAIWSE